MTKGWTKAANSWEARVHMTPEPVEVAKLVKTHGTDAALERWSWIEPRTVQSLGQKGRRLLHT